MVGLRTTRFTRVGYQGHNTACGRSRQSGKRANPVCPAGKDNSGYIYTVCLFSTRSEAIAKQVNARFQLAGHQARILVNERDSQRRYRIAVPGFESRRSALDFADSIRGKLGVADTWIGKNCPAPTE